MDRPRRARKPKAPDAGSVALADAARLVAGAGRILVVSGSGISHGAGLSTFVNDGGLYQRAAKKYGLKEGMRLFDYAFYAARPRDAQRFLGDMAAACALAEPTPTHRALVALERAGRLARHVTLNVDGLAAKAGASLWHARDAEGARGATVELHGCLREVVDVDGGRVYALDDAALARLRDGADAFRAGDAPRAALYEVASRKRRREGAVLPVRFRVLLYGDEEHGAVVDGPEALAALRAAAAGADLVLFLGISFEQSASCEYLREVLAARPACAVVLVNPDAEAAFAARSAVGDAPALKALAATSDALFAAADAAGEEGLAGAAGEEGP